MGIKQLWNWMLGREPSIEELVQESITDEGNQNYRIQVKHNLIYKSWNWRVIKINGSIPRGRRSSNGSDWSKKGAIKQGQKCIEELELQERNAEQQWEDINA